MKKILFYDAKPYDKKFFDKASASFPFEIKYFNGHLNADTVMFSKGYDDPANPSEEFIAVMVCSDADEACPFIPGAATRFSIPYQDPKAYDETKSESVEYDKSCLKIAAELFYLFKFLSLEVIQITQGE